MSRSRNSQTREDELEKEFNRKYGPSPKISDKELMNQALQEALAHKAKMKAGADCHGSWKKPDQDVR